MARRTVRRLFSPYIVGHHVVVGIEFRPLPHRGLRIGSAQSENSVHDLNSDLFGGSTDTATVTTDGVVPGMTLNF